MFPKVSGERSVQVPGFGCTAAGLTQVESCAGHFPTYLFSRSAGVCDAGHGQQAGIQAGIECAGS